MSIPWHHDFPNPHDDFLFLEEISFSGGFVTLHTTARLTAKTAGIAADDSRDGDILSCRIFH